MANYTFSSAYYPDVRAAIGLDMDTISLPDTTLNLPIYKGETELYIRRNLVEAQWSDVNHAATVNYAAVLYMASLVAPTIRLVLKEKIAGGDITYANVDLQEIAADLASRAASRIADVQRALPGEETLLQHGNPNFFTVAKRRRTY